MIRLEQVRGEMFERFERVDRRFAQNEQRAGRVEQRLVELTERIEALRQALAAQLGLTETAAEQGDEIADRATEPVETPVLSADRL
jgi:hypothetical protein